MASGADRQRINEERGLRDLAVALPADATTTHELAAEAELHVGRRYGIEDQVQFDRPTTCDLRVGDLCIDVKWTPRENGGLLLRKKGFKQHICGAYVLVVGPPMRIVGWAKGEDLVASWNPHMPKPCFFLRQWELRDGLDELMAFYGAPVQEER